MTTTPTFTSTFEVLAAAPYSSRETIEETAGNANAAFNAGIVRAMRAASWTAYVYGSATVTEVTTGRVWTIAVTTPS